MNTYFKFAEELGSDIILNQYSSVSDVAANEYLKSIIDGLEANL